MDSIQPPTSPVNPAIQCMTIGCGTMLLTDGTCPRCNPPSRRSTADKLALAHEYRDPKLQRLAHAEVEAGIATGLEYERRAPRRSGPLSPEDRAELERQIAIDDAALAADVDDRERDPG